jgi:demethylmenaquinone methyltransferase/2-methoxy-6-polyprenyl-1,4-benzoquinol methylase
MSDPDPRQAVEKYRRHAAGYDASARRTMRIRQEAVGRLQLAPGARVLDVACGTGLSLGLLAQAVGDRGAVVGVEVSPEMLALARARAQRQGWTQVVLLESSLEQARLAGPFDAVLFHYTHDVLQSPPALQNIFAQVRPGARVAVAGIKHPPLWLFPARLYRLLKARPYVTTFRGLDRPWGLLARHLEDLEIQPRMLGTNYLAWGRARASAAPAGA